MGEKERLVQEYNESFAKSNPTEPLLTHEEAADQLEGELRGTVQLYEQSLRALDKKIGSLQKERDRVGGYWEEAVARLQEFTG